MLTNERLHVVACSACGTLWGEHEKRPDGRPWDEAYVPEAFAQVLRMRREIQARTIAAELQRRAVPTPILDYGTGQGVLLAELRRRGVDAYGCDLDLHARGSVAPRDRLLQVHEPWGLPREQAPSGAFRTLVMLDVLEHHHDPVAFLREQSFDHVLLKLPNATGPAARMAQLRARKGGVRCWSSCSWSARTSRTAGWRRAAVCGRSPRPPATTSCTNAASSRSVANCRCACVGRVASRWRRPRCGVPVLASA